MDSSKKTHRTWRPIAILTAALIAYPASVGPASLALKIAGEPPPVVPFAKPFYRPLLELPQPLLKPLIWWSNLWQ